MAGVERWWHGRIRAPGEPRVRTGVSVGMGASRPVWSTRRQELVLFLRGVTVRVAGRIAIVVGAILSAVNQG